MNSHLADDDVTVHYYDSDYPSAEFGPYPENVDEVTQYQGLAFDVARYREIAAEAGGPVLELCCGTGRVAIPLARAGFEVTAVDVSAGMLERLEENLAREEPAVRARVHPVRRDVVELGLDSRGFRLAILAFNSFLCIPDFELQCRALEAIAGHVAPGGLLVLDIVNPLRLDLAGSTVPKPFFTRRNVHTGGIYTRFAMAGPIDAHQRQRLHGWYDEIDDRGLVTRRYYSLLWRPVFRFEAELMLERAGFEVVALEGGHQREPFSAESPRMLVQARRVSG